VSEWLLVEAKLAIFQLYHGKKLHLNEMMMMTSAFYQTNLVDIFVAHRNNNPWVNHYDTLFWFAANRSITVLTIQSFYRDKSLWKTYRSLIFLFSYFQMPDLSVFHYLNCGLLKRVSIWLKWSYKRGTPVHHMYLSI
jgi:hypothetical protein